MDQFAATARQDYEYHDRDTYGVRQVAGCIPIDRETGKILLITSLKHPGTWVLPKGGVDPGEIPIQAAVRETWEESGVKGTATKHVGVFPILTRNKGKLKEQIWVYELLIDELLDVYPECHVRQRRMFTLQEAFEATSFHAYMGPVLHQCSLAQTTD